jgi:hypothetical protein
VKAFLGFAAVVFSIVASVGIANQNMDDRTMEHCKVSFASNPFDNPAPSSVQTSCGYVYINAHQKNGFGNPDAITRMNAAIHSGKPLTIKATGIAGLALAYEITPEQ